MRRINTRFCCAGPHACVEYTFPCAGCDVRTILRYNSRQNWGAGRGATSPLFPWPSNLRCSHPRPFDCVVSASLSAASASSHALVVVAFFVLGSPRVRADLFLGATQPPWLGAWQRRARCLRSLRSFTPAAAWSSAFSPWVCRRFRLLPPLVWCPPVLASLQQFVCFFAPALHLRPLPSFLFSSLSFVVVLCSLFPHVAPSFSVLSPCLGSSLCCSCSVFVPGSGAC